MAPPSSSPWNIEQQPATLLGRGADGSWHVDGMRWGFDEQWKPRFGDATIDPSHVKDVYLVVEPFKPEWLAAHTFLLYTFDDAAPVRDGQGHTDQGLVVSVEARLRQDQSFDLLKGMQKQFGLIYQLGTWTDVVQKDARRAGHKLIRHRLDLSPDQKKELLEHSLTEATRDRSQEFYHTLNDSCFTNLVSQVNTVLPESQHIGEWIVPGRVHRPLTALPNLADTLFSTHRILAPDAPVQTQPDARLFPGAQARETKMGAFIRSRSDSPFWKPVTATAGLLAGAAAGALVGPPGIGPLIGGLAGFELSRVAADTMKRQSHTQLESCDTWLGPLPTEPPSPSSVPDAPPVA